MSYSGKLQVIHKAKKYSDYMKQREKESHNDKPDPSISGMYANAGVQVYSGGTRRIDRYRFFDIMESDSTVDTALTIIADFITQTEESDEDPFRIVYTDEVSDKEVELIKNALHLWCEKNQLDIKLFDYVRDTIKYGDSFYIVDPETQELIYVEPANVEAIIVDEEKGKEPRIYRIRDVDINLVNKSITTSLTNYASPYGNMGITPSYAIAGNAGGIKENGQLSRGALDVDAQHVLHISLNTKGGAMYPFGESLCTKAFKIYKQKELLTDSSIIFRLQRAVDRRVFKLNTSGMPSHKATAYLERFKNEMITRRIPSKNFLESGVWNASDSIYNPMSLMDDIYLPVNDEGKGSDVSVLSGQTNWEILPEIKFFDDALIRAFGLPQNYFGTQGDENGKNYSAGKLGELLVVEMKTAKMIRRLQKIIANGFDKEFKSFCKKIGIEVDNNIFKLDFHDNLNFGEWVKLDIQSNYISQFKDMSDFSYMSKEFLMKKYLKWSEEDIAENKRLWKLENKHKLDKYSIDTEYESELSAGLSAVGIPKVTEDVIASKDNDEEEGGEGGGGFGGGSSGGLDFGGDSGGFGDDLGGDLGDDFGMGGGEEGGEMGDIENVDDSNDEMTDEIEEESGN